MSSRENRPQNPLQPGGTPEWLEKLGDLHPDVRMQLLAAKIVSVLADDANHLLLETLYEGSSFTPTIGGYIGFESGIHDLQPVTDTIMELRKMKIIQLEHITEATQIITNSEGESEEIHYPVSVLAPTLNKDLAQDFLD